MAAKMQATIRPLPIVGFNALSKSVMLAKEVLVDEMKQDPQNAQLHLIYSFTGLLYYLDVAWCYVDEMLTLLFNKFSDA